MAPLASLLLFLAAVSVKQPEAKLRSGGCDIDSQVVATLALGTAVEIRSSIAGAGGACYRVTAQVDGKTVSGNLPADALTGLEDFDAARRLAASGDSVQMMTAKQVESLRQTLTGATAARSGGGGSALARGPAQQAAALLDQNQPVRALELLEPHLNSGNPDILALAGVAAWKSDRVRLALEHWKAAQAIRPMPQLEAMISQVEKEIAHDKSGEKLVGLRVALRYENQSISYASAKAMLEVLDGEVTRVSGITGCPSHERLVAIVQLPEDYRQGSNAAEWSGGQFDGRIRVPFAQGAQFDERMRRTFAHEVVHACLANLGAWPSWLHEGLAQKLSGERLSAAMLDAIKELASKKQLPKLQDFGADWSRLSTQNARIAYAVALAAAEELVDHYGQSIGLRAILSNASVFERVTADINKHLGLE